MGTKLYVGNLNYNTSEEALRRAFGANGREVASVSIIMDRETGRPRGFAFVEMATAEGVHSRHCKSSMEASLDGRMLRINEARERDPRGPRSFGGPRPEGGGGGGGGYGGPRGRVAAATAVVAAAGGGGWPSRWRRLRRWWWRRSSGGGGGYGRPPGGGFGGGAPGGGGGFGGPARNFGPRPLRAAMRVAAAASATRRRRTSRTTIARDRAAAPSGPATTTTSTSASRPVKAPGASHRDASRVYRAFMADLAAPALPRWLESMLPPGGRRRLVDVGGARMHVAEWGDGLPVVLLHGNPSWGFLWRKVVADLLAASSAFG